MRLRSLFLSALIGSIPAAAAAQRPDVFHRLSPNEAREGAQAGRHRSLSELLPTIRAQVEGDLLRVIGLEDRGGRTVYLLRWKTAGRLLDLEVDAETGQVLRVE